MDSTLFYNYVYIILWIAIFLIVYIVDKILREKV